MTEVDIIAEHELYHAPTGPHWCLCGEAISRDKGSHAVHLVSVLAASGHTIVQLPELDELDCVSATPGSGKVRCYLDDARMTADDARDLAGLLLAAAVAAEEDTND